jgi:hypothetical protein
MASPTDHDPLGALALGCAPHLVGVEVATGPEHHGAAGVEGDETDPLAAAVHHRREDHLDQAGGVVGSDPPGELLGCRDGGLAEPAAAERGEEDVLLAPLDALRHAGGAAGVEDVEVVGGPLGQAGARWRRGRERGFVVVADLERVPERGQVVAQPVEQRGELRLVHHVDRAGVGEDVAQLVGDVAVVHVDRHDSRLERGEHRLEPLGPVPRVDADPLPGLDAGVAQVMGDAVGPLVELAVRQPDVAGDEGEPVGAGVGDDLEEVGQVERSCHRYPP